MEELNVKNVKMVWSRIEDIRELSFDLVTARAVAYADKLLNWANPLVKEWGRIALMKQPNDEENSIILKEIKKKKLSLETEYHYQLFDGDIERVIYVLEK